MTCDQSPFSSPTNATRSRFARNVLRGFTLVELMISVLILLLLLVGLNTVFHTASGAVGAGNTLSDESRSIRSGQAVMAQDFRDVVPDSPAFIMDMQRVSWYQNAQDYANAQQIGSPLKLDVNNAGTAGSSTVTGDLIPPASTNFRSHRIDSISFFKRGGPYHRQTADDGSFVSSTTSNEAWVHYGHLALPPLNIGPQYQFTYTDTNNKSIVFNGPGIYVDDKNRYCYCRSPEDCPASPPDFRAVSKPLVWTGDTAASWVVGRNCILLKDISQISGETYIQRTSAPPNRAWYCFTDNQINVTFTQAWPWQVNLTPLGYDSPQSNYTPANSATPPLVWDSVQPAPGGKPGYNAAITTDRIQHSRIDLATTTIDQYRRIIDGAVLVDSNSSHTVPAYQVDAKGKPTWLTWVRWWHPLVFIQHPIAFNAYLSPTTHQTLQLNDQVQYNPLGMFRWDPSQRNVNDSRYFEWPETQLVNYRFRANPFVSNPMDSYMAAQTAPYFMQHVTQFIVEYAGDYLTEDASGNVTNVIPDGQIDYYVDANGNRRIRWYGLPRDPDNTGHIYGWTPSRTNSPSFTDPIGITGVVPLRDVWRTCSGHAADNGAPFEADVQYYLPPCYSASLNPTGDYALVNNRGQMGMGENARYICAWRNDSPSMVRVIMKFDDSYNRILNGQSMEMVFRIK